MKTLFISIPVLALLFVASCKKKEGILESNPNASPAQNQSQADGQGIKLAHIAIDSGVFVSFWELTPGEIGIRHSARIPTKGDQQSASMRLSNQMDILIEKGATAVDIYQSLARTQKPDELEALKKAVDRQQAREQALATKEKDKTSAQLTKEAAGENDNASKGKRLEACTGDYYDDNFGAQWFLDRFCTEGSTKICKTNQKWYNSGTRKTKWFKTYAMAADFEASCTLNVFYYDEICGFLWTDCEWYRFPKYTIEVAPRTVEGYIITSTGNYESEAQGQSPCRRVHFSAMYNK